MFALCCVRFSPGLWIKINNNLFGLSPAQPRARPNTVLLTVFKISLTFYLHQPVSTTLLANLFPLLLLPGYDGVPVEALQGLDIGSSNANLNESSGNVGNGNGDYDPDLPAPPKDNNQVAAWYDTDL